MPSMPLDGSTKEPDIISELGSFDLSEFPALSNKMGKYSANGSKNDFVIQNEDFPALPGFKAGTTEQGTSQPGSYMVTSQPPSPGLRTSSGNVVNYEQFLMQQQSQHNRVAQMQQTLAQQSMPTQSLTQLQPKPQDKTNLDRQNVDRFGLLGLLSVIRMTDPDLNTLALGTDLTTLGLNLNSSDSLYSAFISPFADIPQKREPEYYLPPCYYMQPPMQPPSSKLSLFSEETLFYIFYSLPRDALQVAAAQELYNRDWRFHKELKLWFMRAPGTEAVVKTNTYERGSYIYFDINTWEKVRKDNFMLVYDQLEERKSGP
jgi:CCR4-NOT transcription complex subunit 2